MKHDYHKDMHDVRKHLDNVVHTHFGPKDFAHMGGAVALINYLEKKEHGPVGHIREELKEAVDYIYYYEVTKNPFYKQWAMHEIEDVKKICESITDPNEKAAAWELIQCLASELERLIAEHESSHTINPVHRPNPGNY